MARVPDLTRVANESSYAGDLRTAAGDATPLSAAAETRHLLTDDPYGDLDPIPWLDRFLYVPDRAVGRLIEHPTEIRAALAQFEASGGVLDASTALTTGYDFLTDGADAVDAGLARRLPEGQRTTLNPETWDAADLDRALFPDDGPAPAIASVNAHYDHNRLLPGVEPPHGDEVLYRTDEVATRGPAGMVGRLLFTMGCHGGTSVPDIYVGTTDPDRLDWAQLVAGSGGSYVGNTGYGYGDTLSVALSERIMALYAERLDGNATVGRALTDAKQVYLGQLGAYSNYDEKAMMQTTFYGLPMYRIGPPTAPPLPTPPPAPATAVDPETGLVAASLTIAPALEEVTAPDGTTFVRADGQEPQVSADRPLIPRTARTFATGDVPMRGALITSLESTIESGVANSVARPVVDDADNEPANRYDDVAFPSQLVTVNHYRTSTGDEQSLVLLAGRFVTDDDPSTPNGTGDRELFTDVGLTTYFSDDPDDRRPVIQPLATELGAGTATFTVLSYDLDEVDDFEVSRRVLVLYRVPGGEWTALDLAPTDEITWSGTGSVPSAATAVEWFVQAVDGAGNVATHTDRGRMLQRSATAPVVDAGPDLTVRLGEPLERSVTVTDADSTRFTGTVDWGNGPQPAEVDGTTLRLSGLATRLGTSTAEVRVCDDGGSCATDQFEVDVLDPDADVVAPVVTGTPDRPANANGWYRAPVTIDWQAVDPAPSSGPPTQPAPSVVETEGAAVEVTSEPSCDPLGNCATGTAVVAMDRTAPGVAITSGLLAPLRLLGGRFTGTATDGLSGVDSVTVTYQAIAGGATTQVTATRSCDATGRSCSWSAALPGTGLYKATATVLDRAGNVRSVATTLTIVLL
jgi:hypothetical protein